MMGTFQTAAIFAAGFCLAALPDSAFAGRSELMLNDGWTGKIWGDTPATM